MQNEAMHMAQQALDVARTALSELSHDLTVVIWLPHDTITPWTSERGMFHAF